MRLVIVILQLHASSKNLPTMLISSTTFCWQSWFDFQDASMEYFTWKPLPNIQADGCIVAFFTEGEYNLLLYI